MVRPSYNVSDLAVKVTAVPSATKGRWCASVRVSGRLNGKPFMEVMDLYGSDYPSELAAIAAGKLEGARRAKAIEHGNPT